jgi:hypothetical protein
MDNLDTLDISEKIKQLQDALDASKKEFNGVPKFEIDNLLPMAQKYLTDKGKAALSNICHSTVIQPRGTMDAFVCIYLAHRVPVGSEEVAVEMLCKAVNHLAAQGKIYATLAPMASMKLALMPLEKPSSVVLSFVLVPANELEALRKEVGCSIEEGALPDPLISCKQELAEDEFAYIMHVTYAANLIANYPINVQERIDHQIKLILDVTPAGTELVSQTENATTGLSVPYTLIFRNPKMKKVKKIDFLAHRDVEMVDGKLEQFNITMGIKYFDKDDKLLYI